MIDLTLLRAFELVARHEGFSAASRASGMSQPSLSQSVAKLESEIGKKLFDRSGRTISLTSAGHALLPRATRLISDADALADDVLEDLESARVCLRVGAIPTIGPYLMPGALRALRAEFPEVRLDLHEATTNELSRMLLANQIQLGVMALPVVDDRLLYEEIGTESLVLATKPGSPLIIQEEFSPTDLEDYGVVTLDELHCLGDAVRGFCSRQGIRNTVSCHAAQLATVESMVAQGLGVSLLPETTMLAAEENACGLAYRRIQHDPPTRTLCAVWNSSAERTDTSRAVIKCLKGEFERSLAAAAELLPIAEAT